MADDRILDTSADPQLHPQGRRVFATVRNSKSFVSRLAKSLPSQRHRARLPHG
jgi:hypothetical protein